MTDKQDIKIAQIQKDIGFIKDGFVRNDKAHEDLKKVMEYGLKGKVSFSRYRVVEAIAFTLAGSTLVWALNQVLQTIEITKALL